MTYTVELTAEISAEYEANPSRETVDAISARIGKTPRSVIAKLASAGVYQTPIRTTKTGELIIKKEELVAELEGFLKLTPGSLETLVKSGKQELITLHKAVKDLHDQD